MPLWSRKRSRLCADVDSLAPHVAEELWEAWPSWRIAASPVAAADLSWRAEKELEIRPGDWELFSCFGFSKHKRG